MSFAQIPEVMNIPYLLETQKKSYDEFLQINVPPDERQHNGLEEAFKSIFPVTNPNNPCSLEYKSYTFGVPKYDIQECMERGMTYAAPLKVMLQLVVREKNEITGENDVQSIKEQECFMGEIPLMTPRGTFIINGAERVIVSQLHRSPGVSFGSGVHPNGKVTYSGRVIPYRGAWVEFEVDINNVMYVMVDRKRKIPATTFLRSFGVQDNEEIATEFFDSVRLVLDDFKKGAMTLDEVTEKYLVNKIKREFIEDVIDPRDPKGKKTLVQAGDKVTKKAADALRQAGVEKVYLDAAEDYNAILGLLLAREVVDTETGEVLAECFEPLTTTRLRRFAVAKVNEVRILLPHMPESDSAVRIDERPVRVGIEDAEKFFDVSMDIRGTVRWKAAHKPQTREDKELFARVEQLMGVMADQFSRKLGRWFGRKYRYAAVPKHDEITVTIDPDIKEVPTDVLLQTVTKDKVRTVEEALVEFFKRMRPGNPVTIQGARRLFEDMFLTEKRYDLGAVGRHKINRRFKLDQAIGRRTLSRADVVAIIKGLAEIAETKAEVDDIDHLGNRRVRSVGELLQNQIRMGLAEMEKTARERMNVVGNENAMPQNLVNAKPIVSAVKDFFSRSQLSQFMDQTNPLSELTHKRRLSALGPGGLSRDRAGFEVRDVHHTHYGRICPIETPEGPNIGLISSLSTYARINDFGFIESPYRKVKDGLVGKDIIYMTADEEDEFIVAQANTPVDEKNHIAVDSVLTRERDDFPLVKPERVRYMDVSPNQLVSVSAALVPFLEHDDANRALMGSNMQRQAVPLVFTDPPVVGTGIEGRAAMDSGACQIAKAAGVVERATATEIVIRNEEGMLDVYPLTKYRRSNQNTCMNQRTTVSQGQQVEAGAVIADGPAIRDGELALGANLLVAFMPFGGYNFEDAILISERVVTEDVLTSIHIEEFELDARDTKLGKEEITRDIPNVSEEMLAKLDEEGLIVVGSEVKPGDILVGKVTPRGETEQSAEDKLLRAIFGEKANDVRDASLKAPPGTYGTVVDVKMFSRKERGAKTEKEDRQLIAEIESRLAVDDENEITRFTKRLKELLGKTDKTLTESGRDILVPGKPVKDEAMDYVRTSLEIGVLPELGRVSQDVKRLFQDHRDRITRIRDEARNKIDRIKAGDELPPGVIKLCKVYVATKRKLQVGDKMAGRHGNKGVVARIMPVEDMPFLADGTAVDIVLNPLGVPSRMNVGQILETHIGWAAHALGFKVATPVFDGASEMSIKALLLAAWRKHADEAGVELTDVNGRKMELKVIPEWKALMEKTQKYAEAWIADSERGPEKRRRSGDIPDYFDVRDEWNKIHASHRLSTVNWTGQAMLHDGATGEAFDRPVTVGNMYMMKLAHLVDDKMHARAIGPYSLVTQQPLGGKAQFGGQRFGEMEVWALEAYGAAYTLQEMLTVKSDDVTGRTKIYESIIKGENNLQPGIPESFNVLVKELQALGLNMELLTEDASVPFGENEGQISDFMMTNLDDHDPLGVVGGPDTDEDDEL